MPHGEEQETHRAAINRNELVTRLAGLQHEDGNAEPIEGLHVYRASQPTSKVRGVSRPSLCAIAQGSKEIYLGTSRYRYDAQHYLLTTVELPITGQVVEASREHPYLAMRLELEPSMVSSVMVEAGLQPPRGPGDAKALVVSALETDLLDALVRLVRLAETPDQARVLVPLVKREIVFRLLMGEQGHRLRHLPTLGNNSHLIAQAIARLRKDFDQPLRIEVVARELGMSSSGFHHHFKAITDMSPLQFQKELRLQEARRLMLGESLDAASAAFRVGYHDTSQFSREYKRHFGQPPTRDIEQLRHSAVVSAGA